MGSNYEYDSQQSCLKKVLATPMKIGLQKIAPLDAVDRSLVVIA